MFKLMAYWLTNDCHCWFRFFPILPADNILISLNLMIVLSHTRWSQGCSTITFLIYSLIESSFSSKSSKHHKFQTIRARYLKFLHNIHHPLCAMCHMWHVTCHLFHVMCQMYFYFFFLPQIGGTSWWSVCYQRGRPRLIFYWNLGPEVRIIFYWPVELKIPQPQPGLGIRRLEPLMRVIVRSRCCLETDGFRFKSFTLHPLTKTMLAPNVSI